MVSSVAGHRSVNLLKLKDFADAEYRITSYTDGRRVDSGAIIFTCLTPDGKSFQVRPAWTLERRRQAYQSGHRFIGQWLTVKFSELSQDAVPRFPVGVEFKTDRQD